MIRGGNKEKAREVQDQWVHCLGNLTLSAYNSKLSDRAFGKKQQHTEISVEGDKLSIGYKNHLPLNELPFKLNSVTSALAKSKKWTAAEIEARNTAIVDRCMNIFRL